MARFSGALQLPPGFPGPLTLGEANHHIKSCGGNLALWGGGIPLICSVYQFLFYKYSLTPWLISSYQSDSTECRVGKKYTESVLTNLYKTVPVHDGQLPLRPSSCENIQSN